MIEKMARNVVNLGGECENWNLYNIYMPSSQFDQCLLRSTLHKTWYHDTWYDGCSFYPSEAQMSSPLVCTGIIIA
jgi:hypothetical protein